MANSMKYGLSVLGSAGLHVHDELSCAFSGLAVAMALKIAESPEPIYITRLESPGAMPSACVISRVCSVSSQPCALKHVVGVPSTDFNVIGTLLVCLTFL